MSTDLKKHAHTKAPHPTKQHNAGPPQGADHSGNLFQEQRTEHAAQAHANAKAPRPTNQHNAGPPQGADWSGSPLGGQRTERAVQARVSVGAHIYKATEIAHGITARNSGFESLNAELPGEGWPVGMLTELITREAGIGELRLLVPLLRQLTRERKVVILLAPPMVPYAPALASFGIDLDYLIVIQAANAADRLWAVEQTLKSASFGTLLAWLPQKRTRPEHLRRMQLAAQSATGPVFLFRQLQAQFENSPAPLRLLLLPRPNEQLSVQLLKRRGPVMAMPLMLELPKPAASVHIKPSVVAIDTDAPLNTVHAHADSPANPLNLPSHSDQPTQPTQSNQSDLAHQAKATPVSNDHRQNQQLSLLN